MSLLREPPRDLFGACPCFGVEAVGVLLDDDGPPFGLSAQFGGVPALLCRGLLGCRYLGLGLWRQAERLVGRCGALWLGVVVGVDAFDGDALQAPTGVLCGCQGLFGSLVGVVAWIGLGLGRSSGE